MRSLVRCGLMTFLLSSLALALGAQQPDPLEGVWLVKAITFDGKKIPEAELKDRKLVIKKDTYEIFQGDKLAAKGTFKLDPDKNPKTLDVLALGADGKKLPTMQGIYKLEGDTLTLSGVKEGMPRPTEFASKEGSKIELIVYERKK